MSRERDSRLAIRLIGSLSALLLVGTLCVGCDVLIPAVKVAPPPSASDAELKKADTPCTKTQSGDAKTQSSADCAQKAKN